MAGKMTKILMLLALVALVGAGCSDDDPAAVPANTDTAPPAVPTNVTANYAASARTVTISWDANTIDRDLVGYVVDKDYQGTITPLVASPITALACQDTNPQPGVTKYYVYAVDQAGNESAVATAMLQLDRTHAGDRSDAN
jgi:hypothetical protein